MYKKLTPRQFKGERKYYLRDTCSVVGNCILWWRKDFKGYTCDLRDAHVFTEKEAFERHKNRSTDRPYPIDLIFCIAKMHVDHQDLDRIEYIEDNKTNVVNLKE